MSRLPPTNEPRPFDDDVPWQAWTPAQAAARLNGLRTPRGRPVRWAVAAGWAIDLFLGRITREHEDLEIIVLGDDVPTVLGAFPGPEWRWDVPIDGWLHPLMAPAYQKTHQTWLWSEPAGAFVLDVFRDRHDGDTWICRRDPSIRLPWAHVVATDSAGLPYLVPQVVLLFKAKHARVKDLADLRAALPALDDDQRRWLRQALARAHPGHEWLEIV